MCKLDNCSTSHKRHYLNNASVHIHLHTPLWHKICHIMAPKHRLTRHPAYVAQLNNYPYWCRGKTLTANAMPHTLPHFTGDSPCALFDVLQLLQLGLSLGLLECCRLLSQGRNFVTVVGIQDGHGGGILDKAGRVSIGEQL